jgi:iron transport multicopper oxidase
MFYLFLRELFWQLMAALHEVDEEDAAEEAEWALADEAAALAEARAEGRLSPLQSGDGGDISCGDEDDDAGVWRSPPVGEEDEPRCGTLQRACWALAACLALGLGLGLGLRHDVAAPPVTPHGLPVARFTLVIGRGPTLADSGKYGITVNGSSPGPTLRMPLGSRAEVMVINELGDDVTAVHWHGLSQRGSPFADGALGVTQCGVPFAPAGANHMLYAFTPNRAGTFWYHGHYGGQYPDGLYGALVVDDGGAAIAAAAVAAAAAAANGTAAAAPSGAVALAVNASASYDADSWVWLAADWHDAPVMSLLPGYLSGESGGGYEPMPDAIIVSGARSGAAGAAYSTARTARQLVRVVNTGTLSMWRVSVDGMPLTLVELDGTACAPLDVAALELNVAQRAAFVLDWARLHADVAASPAIWFHIDAMPAMYRSYAADAPDAGLYGSSSGQPFDTTWRGVIRFEEDMRRLGAAVLPNYTLAPELNLPSRVDTPNLFAARSWPLAPAPAPTHDIYLEVSVSFDENGVRRALMNGATALMDATAGVTVPELYAYTSAAGGPLSDEDAPLGGRIHGSGAVPFVLPLDAVVDVLINNTDAAEHPFHLHGHTFWAVASSAAPGAGAAYAPHYVRRDVVSVPAFGWARIRFAVDNPGVWLMHCHVEWHMHAGMSATFVEAPSELADGGASGRFVTPPTHAAACALAAGMPPH